MCTVYANSLLATLNTRRLLRKQAGRCEDDHVLPVIFQQTSGPRRALSRGRLGFQSVSLLDHWDISGMSEKLSVTVWDE